jgi:hypothetical protein
MPAQLFQLPLFMCQSVEQDGNEISASRLIERFILQPGATYPAKLKFAVVAAGRFLPEDVSPHTVGLSLLDPNGGVKIRIDEGLKVDGLAESLPAGQLRGFNVVADLELLFDQEPIPGYYSIELRIDGSVVGCYRFTVECQRSGGLGE